MHSVPKISVMPSGKRIVQFFDRGGQLAGENHVYLDSRGVTSLSIAYTFSNGQRTGQLYYGHGILSRAVYEERRKQYPDMPAADPSVPDQGVEKLEKLEQRRRDRAAAAERLGFEGHVVIELPEQSSARVTLLKQLDRIARKQGYRGDPDSGQRLTYVKWD